MLLNRLALVIEDAPSFLVPLFVEYPGANAEFTHEVDDEGRITAFREIEWNGSADSRPPSISVELGGEGVVAFRDHLGTTHVGTEQRIKDLCRALLEDKAIQEFPMSAFNMAAFVDALPEHRSIVINAYDFLGFAESRSAANAWRDVELFLPAVRRDILSELELRDQTPLSSVFVSTRGRNTIVFVPPEFARHRFALKKWRAVADLFGIDEHEIRVFARSPRERSPEAVTWTVLGHGGVADFTITRAPFRGRPTTGGFFVARGVQRVPGGNSRPRLTVGIVPSELGSAGALSTLSQELTSLAYNHALNIRPIGFGTSRPNKASAEEISSLLDGFDATWVVAQHRLHKPSGHYSGLRASTLASRIAKDAVQALISCLRPDPEFDLLETCRKAPGVGLFGSALPAGGYKEDEQLLGRVLYNMLSEDHDLATAKEIVVLWPQELRFRGSHERVKIGGIWYSVRVVVRSDRMQSPRAVGFALRVSPRNRNAAGFRAFCVALMSGYGWTLRDDLMSSGEDLPLVFENEGEFVHLSTATTIEEIKRLTAFERLPAPVMGHILVTNLTVPRSILFSNDVTRYYDDIIHYSRLSGFMNEHYRAGLFEDW